MSKKLVLFSLLVSLFVLVACGGGTAVSGDPVVPTAVPVAPQSVAPDGAAPVVLHEVASAPSKKASPVTVSEATPEEAALAVEMSAGNDSVISVSPDMAITVMGNSGKMLPLANAGTNEHPMGVTSAPNNSEAYVVTATPDGKIFKYVVTPEQVKQFPLSSLSIPAMSQGVLSPDGGWLAYVDASSVPYVGLVYVYANGASRIELPAQLHDVIVGNLVWLNSDKFAVMVYDVAASAAASKVPQAATDQEPPHKWWTVTINGRG